MPAAPIDGSFARYAVVEQRSRRAKSDMTSPVDFSSVSRVLVIHLRHYGDVLMMSPVFSALKKHAPHIEIDALIYDLSLIHI